MEVQLGNTISTQMPDIPKSETKKEQAPTSEINNAAVITRPEYQYLDEKKRTGETLTISEKVVYEAIEKANKAVEGQETYFKFTVHKKTNEICVKVVNSETNEVIREIPSEKILDMVAKMCEMAGIFVDEKR